MKKLEQRVPNLRFKGFTNDWEQRKLGDVVNLIGGGPFKSTDSVSKGIPWLKIANVGVNGITWNTESYLPEYFWNDYPQYQLKKGNYVVALTRPILNHRLKISKLDRDALLNQRVAKLTTSENLQYIVHLLERKKVVLQIENNLSGSDPPNLSSKDLYRIKIKIPSESNEQKQIGTFLQNIDHIIALQQRKLALLKQLKKGMLQKMLAEKNSNQPVLRFKGFYDDWEQRKLIQVANYRNGRAHEKDINMNGNYIVVNSKFVSSNGRVKKFSSKLMEPLNKGEIAFVLSDVPNGKALARTFLVKEGHKYSLNQRIAGITPHQNISSYFLYILMNRNPYFLKFDDGVGQTNLSKKDVEQFSDHYPSGEEQQMIGKVFGELDRLIALQQQKLAKYQSVKKSLLQQMFI